MIIDEPERVRLLLWILSDCMQKYKCIFAKLQYMFSRRYLGFAISCWNLHTISAGERSLAIRAIFFVKRIVKPFLRPGVQFPGSG
jgi:hypothetical protein